MENHTLSRIFIDVFNNLSTTNGTSKIPKLNISDYDTLEKSLQDYLVSILGISIRNNYEEHYREIRKYFENIFNNDYTGVMINDTMYGYKPFENGVLFWKENFLIRDTESLVSCKDLTDHYSSMILLN